MLNNLDLKKVLQKVEALEKYHDKHFQDLTVKELNDYYIISQLLIDYVKIWKKG